MSDETPGLKGFIQETVYNDDRGIPVWRITAHDSQGNIIFTDSGSIDLISSYRRVGKALLHNWLNTRDQLYVQEVAGTSVDTEPCE